MKKSEVLFVGCALIYLSSGPVAAQVVGGGQSVADRPRPLYDPVGSKAGGFTLFPSVTVSAEATDNYLATNTGRRSDVYAVVRPEIYARSDWSRHRLDARAFVDQSVHARLTNENATQYGTSVSGAYDIARQMQLRADASAGHFVESRTSLASFQGSAKPVSYDVYHVGIGLAQNFNDLVLDWSAAFDRRDFKDTLLPGNVVFDQDYRDVRVLTAGGSARYDLRNGIGLIVSGQLVDERYTIRPGRPGFVPGTSVDRASSGFNIDGGVTLELSRLVFGQLRVGYLKRRYRDPALNDFGGLSYSGDVLWNLTALTSLRFRASRSVEDSSSPLVAGNTRDDFRISVDHELYRNVILSGDAGYGNFSPNGVGIGGNDYSVGVGARYFIDRRFTVTGNLRHSGRSSDSQFLRYNATTASVGLRIAF